MAGILLIDDALLMRNLIRMILEKNGYNVCGEASNGKAGLEVYRRLQPDLVFCDIMMEEMDGVECMKMILGEDADAKVVICTSAGDELHNMEALTAGAKAFITKPFNAAEVLRVTESLIGRPGSGAPAYRSMMEERAKAAGLDGKPMLDFVEAFGMYSGIKFDDPKVDADFLKQHGQAIAVGVKALLAAKMTQKQADGIVDIFLEVIK